MRLKYLLILVPTSVFAQTSPGAAGSGGGAAPGGNGGTTVVVTPPAVQAPAAPQGPMGGGNAQYSSSKPITGPNDRDGFDLGPKGGGGGKTVTGGENGAIFTQGSRLHGNSNARVHTVRRGDTLWEICDFHFQNPYQWPRIWSYNPQIQNPHWIYPGELVQLREGADDGKPQSTAQGSLVDRRRQVVSQTIFLKNQGFIEDEKDLIWGELSGSREDKTILTDFDEVYMQMSGTRDVKIGMELTIFRPVKSLDQGKIVEIQGSIRVDQWNPKTGIARGRITESVDTIERGARVGPMERTFEIVPPARNESDVDAKVLTSVSPHILYGSNQVVFIDAGTKAGLKAGNRVFIVRKGDGYHRSLPSKSAAKRIAIESDSAAQIETVPEANPSALPPEFEGELRVINARENSSLCIVLNSRREIESGDVVVGRKGY
jgi:hypothetical protein